MVKLRYLGQNYISFGNHKIVNGYNELADADFYKLMQYPTFAARVNSKVFSVPPDFPLELPKKEEKKSDLDKDSKDLELKSENEAEDNNALSQRDLLKQIAKSDDEEYLKDLANSDKRAKVANAVDKRLAELQDAKKDESKG